MNLFLCKGCGHPVDEDGNWKELPVGLLKSRLKEIEIEFCEHESLFPDPIHYIPKELRKEAHKEMKSFCEKPNE